MFGLHDSIERNSSLRHLKRMGCPLQQGPAPHVSGARDTPIDLAVTRAKPTSSTPDGTGATCGDPAGYHQPRPEGRGLYLRRRMHMPLGPCATLVHSDGLCREAQTALPDSHGTLGDP